MKVMHARVFLSYSRANGDRAAALARELEVLGHDVWRDTDDIRGGEAWRRSIVHGIRSADLVVLLLSEASSTSANVQRELDIADEEHRPVVPVLIEPAVMSDEMKYNLAGIQLLDVTSLDATTSAAAIHRAVADVPVDPSRATADAATVVNPLVGPTGAPAPDADGALVPPAEVAPTARGRRRTGAIAAVTAVAVVVVVVIGVVARSRGDGWNVSGSPFEVPCRGLGQAARTPVRGQGATPGTTVHSTWRNVRTGQHGDMDDTKVDNKGRFRIGFECLRSEVGETWTLDATDSTHTFHWIIEGASA
jgi:hypothetical protein